MYNNFDPNNVEYQEAYRRARQRVEAKMGFYSHLTSYVIVNGFFIVIYLFTFGGYPWFIWPMLAWGIGLAFHFMSVFGFGRHNSSDVRQRMIQEELRRMGISPAQPYANPNSAFSGTNPDTQVNGNTYPGQVPPDRR